MKGDDFIRFVMDTPIIDALWPLFINMTVRGTLGLLAIWLLFRIWRKASAGQQHLGWSFACIAILILSIAHISIPTWKAPILPTVDFTLVQSSQNITEPTTSLVMPTVAHISATKLAELSNSSLSIHHLLLGIWGAGVIISLVVLTISHIRAKRLTQHASPITDPRALQFLDAIHRSFALRRRVTLRQDPAAMPMTYGIWAPVILLPNDFTTWTDERLWDILVHEFAHVKRFDCLTHTIASTVCALQWFNPMMWYTILQLRDLREEACDNYVLASGSCPSSYASHLLELADTFRTYQFAAASFARTTRLQQRLLSILNIRKIRTPMTARNSARVLALSAILIVPFTSITPAPRMLQDTIFKTTDTATLDTATLISNPDIQNIHSVEPKLVIMNGEAFDRTEFDRLTIEITGHIVLRRGNQYLVNKYGPKAKDGVLFIETRYLIHELFDSLDLSGVAKRYDEIMNRKRHVWIMDGKQLSEQPDFDYEDPNLEIDTYEGIDVIELFGLDMKDAIVTVITTKNHPKG